MCLERDIRDFQSWRFWICENDYLYPRFRNAKKGRVVAQGAYHVGYSTAAMQLKRFCLKNSIPVLTMYSGRRGGVMLAVECGIDRMTIQRVGNWSSDAVEGYYQPEKPGSCSQKRLFKGCEVMLVN